MDDEIELMEYEDYPIKGRVYPNVYELVNANPTVKTDKKIIVFLTNWMYGFGSALTIYMQNALFLKDLNPNIIALPHYSNNTKNFKYHDERLNNSFFLYYQYNHEDPDIRGSKIYFASSILLQTPFVSGQFPILDDPTNTRFIDYFQSQFRLRPNDHGVKEYMDFIRKEKQELIGIHIRSIAQKQNECPGYLQVTFQQRLEDLKRTIDRNHPNAVLFVASDVELYIEKAKKLFGNEKPIHYLDYITRIENEGDSIPQLEAYKGYKLGSDILDDCLALSMCDKIYISNSNIPFIITLLNKSVPMEEY